jgi:hypothetical protein
MADLYSMFASPDDATAEEQAQALAAALRRKSDLATIAQLTGDRVLAPLGQSLQQDVTGGQHMLATAGAGRLRNATEAKRNAIEDDFKRQEIGIQRGKAAAESWLPVQTGKGIFEVNRKTGELRPLSAGGDEPLPTKGTGAGGLNDKTIDADFLKLGDAVSTVKGRNSLQPQYQKAIDRAARLEALLKMPDGSLVNATPQQVREASTALASLISGGGPGAVSQIEELTPETMAGKWANLKQKFLNEPTGADAQAFLQNMLDTAARETALARKQMRAGQLQGLPAFAHLRKADKARFDSIIKAAGIDPSTVDDNGLAIEASAKTTAPVVDDAKALKWARAHPDNPDAQKILALHGGR